MLVLLTPVEMLFSCTLRGLINEVDSAARDSLSPLIVPLQHDLQNRPGQKDTVQGLGQSSTQPLATEFTQIWCNDGRLQ